MRIAQVAPLYESVPPKLYGGTERVVAWLTDELADQGHDVTLFASGDSDTRARLVPCWPQSLRLDEGTHDHGACHLVMLEEVVRRADQFDIIHWHVDYIHFPVSRRLGRAHVTTLHGRLDIPELGPLYHEYAEMPVISISDAQREPLPHATWVATVHHGLPPDLHQLSEEPGRYLAFLGRISPEKRVDRAIEIARQAGLPIRIAAKVDPVDQQYFEQEIEPLLQQPFVEFIGEIGEHEKTAFLGGARALLFPIDWREPFGLVMIEALACGTPIIAWPEGSVREVVEEAVTGFIVNDIEEAARAVREVERLSRRRCRDEFERRFTVQRMAYDYVRVYEGLVAGRLVGWSGGRLVRRLAAERRVPSPEHQTGRAIQPPIRPTAQPPR
ncbi:MAG: glycosyltransferase family 4 protein [Gemmatimonadales bacterium]